MTAIKKMALIVCVLAFSSASVQAGPFGRSNSRWTTWISNQSGSSNGSGYTISGPANLNLFSSGPASAPQTVAASPVGQSSAPVTQQLSAVAASPVTSVGTLSAVAASSTAPTPVQTFAPVVNTTPVETPPSVTPAAPATVSSAPTYDAYIDLNGGPYLNSSTLTSGGAQAWYNSPTAIQAFGGTPNAQQQASFDQAVLSRVEQTFQLSGMNPTITIDPTANALHTISVVSNTTNPNNPNALGMTNVGGNGFGYIDNLAPLNPTVDQLEWAVAHNVAHELMHAFGIATHPDQTGMYLDSASATAAVLTDPNTTFSPAAVSLIQATNYGANVNGAGTGAETLATNQYHVGPKCPCIFCRGLFGTKKPTTASAENLVTPVPEPAAMMIWGLSMGIAGVVMHRKRASKRAA